VWFFLTRLWDRRGLGTGLGLRLGGVRGSGVKAGEQSVKVQRLSGPLLWVLDSATFRKAERITS